MADSSFGPVAPYYDELMKSVPYRMWTGYYLLLLSQQDVHPKTILDVCSGTGTMCEMLHAEGFRLAGVDLAPGMIAEARRKAEKKKLPIRYEVGDAARFDMGETYDAALSFFDSLNNILDPDDLQSAFHRVFAHLNPGGSFIFDLNMAYAFEERMFDQEHLNPRSKLRYTWVGDYDPGTRIITVRMKFWYGGQEFDEVHRQRAYAKDEVFEMLERAGFTDLRAYHSYTLDRPRPKSDRLHFTAIRPKDA
jgi:SAM-dependent methyltransferase